MFMLSMPPATITSASPARMAEAPIITAFRPEPQTLLMVVALTPSGSPAFSAAWRAGAWPAPAWRTWPMIASSIFSTATPDRSTAARMATAPSSVAGVVERPPPNLPMGVRAAERRYTSRMRQWYAEPPRAEIKPSGQNGRLAQRTGRVVLQPQAHVLGVVPELPAEQVHPPDVMCLAPNPDPDRDRLAGLQAQVRHRDIREAEAVDRGAVRGDAPALQHPELRVLLLPPARGQPATRPAEVTRCRPLAQMGAVDPDADVARPIRIVEG